MKSWPFKDPDEVADYDFNWTDRLLSSDEIDAGTTVPADTIFSSDWIVVEGTVHKDSDTFSATHTKLWLSGGTLGETCLITNRIVTAGGRTFDNTVKLKIKAK